MTTSTRPDFMEPLLLYICYPQHVESWIDQDEYDYEPERWVAAQEREEADPWAQGQGVEGAACPLCEGCGYQLGGTEDTYCHDCVYEMDQGYAEKAIKTKKSCTSCGAKFKDTEVGIRCQCEMHTHGRLVSHGS